MSCQASLRYCSGEGRSSLAMRSRRRASISAFWCALARLVKGNAARFRASRIRVETTISASGPVPRSHSPVVGIRLSRFIRGFLLTDQVAELGGEFVVLRIDRPAKLLPELEDLRDAVLRRQPAGHLADVAGRPMDALQDRQQAGP